MHTVLNNVESEISKITHECMHPNIVGYLSLEQSTVGCELSLKL